jgi:hypothetical protein
MTLIIKGWLRNQLLTCWFSGGNKLSYSMTQKQLDACLIAQRKRESLLNLAEEISTGASKRHVYVYSPAGLGKTHAVLKALETHRVPYKYITGSVTIAFFAVELATMLYENPGEDEILLVVDDCDSMFLDVQFANIIKGVLEKSKSTLQYNKYAKGWTNTLSETQRKAVEAFSTGSSVGFSVPTSRFRFCFLSNIKLPTRADLHKRGAGRAYELELHRSAIRSRCKTLDLDMPGDVTWGWVSNVVMDSKAIIDELGEEDYSSKTGRILQWMWTNRGQMKELSIRTAQKMAESISNGGDSDDWEDEFLENRNAA